MNIYIHMFEHYVCLDYEVCSVMKSDCDIIMKSNLIRRYPEYSSILLNYPDVWVEFTKMAGETRFDIEYGCNVLKSFNFRWRRLYYTNYIYDLLKKTMQKIINKHDSSFYSYYLLDNNSKLSKSFVNQDVLDRRWFLENNEQDFKRIVFSIMYLCFKDKSLIPS